MVPPSNSVVNFYNQINDKKDPQKNMANIFGMFPTVSHVYLELVCPSFLATLSERSTWS